MSSSQPELETSEHEELFVRTYTVGTDGGDLQIVNIDISFVMSNYCNIAIFIAVELLGIRQKVFVV